MGSLSAEGQKGGALLVKEEGGGVGKGDLSRLISERAAKGRAAGRPYRRGVYRMVCWAPSSRLVACSFSCVCGTSVDVLCPANCPSCLRGAEFWLFGPGTTISCSLLLLQSILKTTHVHLQPLRDTPALRYRRRLYHARSPDALAVLPCVRTPSLPRPTRCVPDPSLLSFPSLSSLPLVSEPSLADETLKP